VTTVVDAGSAGWMTFRGLRDYDFTFVDSVGNEVKASRRLRTRHVVRAGRRVGTPSSPSDLVA
jgi:predicted amidohydrolase